MRGKAAADPDSKGCGQRSGSADEPLSVATHTWQSTADGRALQSRRDGILRIAMPQNADLKVGTAASCYGGPTS
jgi:hypothetical protein